MSNYWIFVSFSIQWLNCWKNYTYFHRDISTKHVLSINFLLHVRYAFENFLMRLLIIKVNVIPVRIVVFIALCQYYANVCRQTEYIYMAFNLLVSNFIKIWNIEEIIISDNYPLWYLHIANWTLWKKSLFLESLVNSHLKK